MKAVPLLLALTFVIPVLPSVSGSASSPIPQASGWTIELVHAFGGSSPPAIRLDGAGHPHVLACPPGQVWYAVRENSAWREELVANTVAGGVCGKLALDAGGDPRITIPPRAGDPGQMYGVRLGGGWSFLPVPFPVADLEIGSASEPAIVGVGASLRFAVLEGGWQVETVEAFGGSAGLAWADLEFDGSGAPRVLYYDSVRGDVRYAFRDAAGWHVEVVEHIGALNAIGRQGSLALDSLGSPHTAYVIRTQPMRLDTFYALRGPSGWTKQWVANGYAPSLGIRGDGVPVVGYKTGFPGLGIDIATRTTSAWSVEPVPDPTSGPAAAQFPMMILDRCDKAHLVWYDFDLPAVLYATKGGPCGPSQKVSFHLEPETLNLKSNGRWVTAYLATENASFADIDAKYLRLNGVAVAWSAVLWNHGLMAKFDRAAFAATLAPGDAVTVTLTGRWRDDGTFTATDTIRVIKPGR